MDKSSDLPLASIIIPAYNAAHYIKETLDSALSQTYPNIEVIVVDNASIDATQSILKPYVERGAIIYFRLLENIGPNGARNMGIQNAHGEFIALLDSDDIFLPDKIERQVSYLLEYPDCGVCYCDIWHFYDNDPTKLLKLEYIYYSGDEVFSNLLIKNFINPLSVVMRRSAIEQVGPFNERYRHGEDWEYWIRFAYQGVIFYHLPEILGKYRMKKAGQWYPIKVRIEEKEMVVRIFEDLKTKMSPAERRKYHMSYIVFRHRIRLWYVWLERIIPFFDKIHELLQKRRLSEV